MQNLELPLEKIILSELKILGVRLNLAWKIITNSKAIVLHDNQIYILNMEKPEVISIFDNISQSKIKDDKTKMLTNNLVCLN